MEEKNMLLNLYSLKGATEAAIRYIELGLPTFPIKPGDSASELSPKSDFVIGQFAVTILK